MNYSVYIKSKKSPQIDGFYEMDDIMISFPYAKEDMSLQEMVTKINGAKNCSDRLFDLFHDD